MKKGLVSGERVDKLRRDRVLLPYDDFTISKKMGMTASYYVKSVNSGAISGNFLYKFYAAFKEELIDIKDGVKAGNYRIVEFVDEAIKRFDNKYEELIRSHQGISEELLRLEQKFDRIMGQRLANIETMVASIVKNKG